MAIIDKVLGRSNKETGNLAENAAQQYLEQQGLRLVCRNFSCRNGEIDLIMLDKQHLVFIEVRFRQHHTFGNAIESITPHKQNRIKKTASYYLLIHNLVEKKPCRFDIVAITNYPSGQKIEWVKNAF